MRFMILRKADKKTEEAAMPNQALFAAMGKYMEAMAEAGVLLAAEGLQPSAKGARVKFSGGTPMVIDGPFTESKELVAGYTLIQVKSKEEAMEWVRRFPNPHLDDGEIEVRQLYELEDFGPSETTERFRDMGIATEK